MKLTPRIVPYSSVVGSSVALHDEAGAITAIVMVTVPRPSLDYKEVAVPIIETIAAAFAAAPVPEAEREEIVRQIREAAYGYVLPETAANRILALRTSQPAAVPGDGELDRALEYAREKLGTRDLHGIFEAIDRLARAPSQSVVENCAKIADLAAEDARRYGEQTAANVAENIAGLIRKGSSA